MMHKREQFLAPARQSWESAGRDNGLMAGIIYYSCGIEFSDLPTRYRDFESFGDVGLLHKAEAKFDTNNTRSDWSDDDSIFVRYPRGFHRHHSDEQYILMQDTVAFGVMRECE